MEYVRNQLLRAGYKVSPVQEAVTIKMQHQMRAGKLGPAKATPAVDKVFLKIEAPATATPVSAQCFATKPLV